MKSAGERLADPVGGVVNTPCFREYPPQGRVIDVRPNVGRAQAVADLRPYPTTVIPVRVVPGVGDHRDRVGRPPHAGVTDARRGLLPPHPRRNHQLNLHRPAERTGSIRRPVVRSDRGHHLPDALPDAVGARIADRGGGTGNQGPRCLRRRPAKRAGQLAHRTVRDGPRLADRPRKVHAPWMSTSEDIFRETHPSRDPGPELRGRARPGGPHQPPAALSGAKRSRPQRGERALEARINSRRHPSPPSPEPARRSARRSRGLSREAAPAPPRGRGPS